MIASNELTRLSHSVVFMAIVVFAGVERDACADAPNAEFQVETVTYKQVADLDIQADVYRLAGRDVRPAVMWIHGGALVFGDRKLTDRSGRIEEVRRLLAAGFVVVSIDYRLAPETKLPQIIDDVKDAWIWLRSEGSERFRIDPDRVAVAGQSAGGYLTLMAGAVLDPSPRALVSFYGYGNIAGNWLMRPSPHYTNQPPAIEEQRARNSVGTQPLASTSDGGRGLFYLWCRQQGRWPEEVSGLSLSENPDALKPYCPVHLVTAGYPPTLLLHGDRDTDVPHSQSLEMAEVLDAHGVEHRTVILEGLGHGFDMALLADERISGTFDEAVEFLTTHTRKDTKLEKAGKAP